ncbi:MAG: 50S ribosomal protein L24 [Halobacteria archaeon]
MPVLSKQPRKQRLFRHRAPLHIRHKFVHAHLSPALRKEYGHRSVRVSKGDTVRVMRGDFAGKEGVVQGVDLREGRVIVEGIVVAKADGTEKARPMNPAALMVTKLELKDRVRAQRLKASGATAGKEGA